MKKELTPYQKQALDFEANILLTANAGSGKTFVLSKRFVEIILKEDVELDNIVAITFTDKAAGELNKRIAGEIESRIASETDEQKLRKLESVRRQLVSANISTIHSFCVSVLREFAPEAGIDANFFPIDQLQSYELINLTIEDTINRLIVHPEYESKIKYLIRLFGSKLIFKDHLFNAIEERKTIDNHLIELYCKESKEIKIYYRDIFEKHFNQLFSNQINLLLKYIEKINDFVLNSGNEIASEISRLLKIYDSKKSLLEKNFILKEISSLILTNSGTVKKQKYLSKGREDFDKEIAFIESFFGEILEIISVESADDSEEELINFGKNFISVYNYAVSLYSERKKQKGFVDFEDILLYTQTILTLEDVRLYLQKKYKYIMIDEYQDTNELQYRIFMPILDYLKQGNLFVVGDEKQSIYRFRNADLEIFNKTKEDILNHSYLGKLLQLPHSFRMAPQLVLFTNKLFSKLFCNPLPVLNEVDYSDLICAKHEDEIGSVQFIIVNNSENISEAEFTANKILELFLSKEINSFNEIGILCRKRDFFKELEIEFTNKKIPYTIIGGKGFYQRQSVYDVYNYLSFLINRNDDTALIGMLRSPFFTISDLELLKISRETGDSFYDKLINYSLKHKEVSNVTERLNAHLKISRNVEIYSLIRTILLESGYWTVIASKRNAKQEIANLEKLLFLARSYSRKSFKSLYDFTIELKDAIKNVEDEGQAQIVQDDNSVKILTIHQAKELEFPTVFLYGCNTQALDDRVKTKGMSIDKTYGFLTKVYLNNNIFGQSYTPPVTALYNYINYKKNVAEIKRLLYVAVTRAMNNLYIVASHQNNKPKSDSFFDLFVKGLNLDLEKEEYVLSDDIEFMKSENGKYIFEKKKVELKIPLIKSSAQKLEFAPDNTERKTEKSIIVDTIDDIPKGEIISATKISMFSQCPVKYELTYDLGYTDVLYMIKKNKYNYEYNYKEDDELKPFAALKGRIIHSLLSRNIDVNVLNNEIGFHLLMEEDIKDVPKTDRLKQQIQNELTCYFNSNTFKELNAYKVYKNEYEVYTMEGKNFLYGIIDKLIIEKGRLIIVDYKTDDITIEQITERANEYKTQLKFYAYILKNLFKDYSTFELRLVFIKYPDNPVISILQKQELIEYQNRIQESIVNMLKRDYKPNLSHCIRCNFSLEGNKCIKHFS